MGTLLGEEIAHEDVSETREFVWNLVTKELGEQMNKMAAPLAYGVSEFEIAGLTVAPSRHVSVPRVRESRAAMECKVTEIIQFKNWKGETVQGRLVLGEVVDEIDEVVCPGKFSADCATHRFGYLVVSGKHLAKLC